MIKHVFLTISTFFSLTLLAQTTIQWQKHFGGSNFDVESSIIQSNNNIYVAYSSLSSDGDQTQNRGGYDISIINLDNAGNIQWKKEFGGNLNEKVRIIKAIDNNIYIAGYTESNSNDFINSKGGKDLFVIKLDLQGNVVWNKRLGGTTDEDISDICSAEGNLINCFAHSKSSNGDLVTNHGGYDYWFFQLDSDGNIQQSSSFGGSADDISSSGLSLSNHEKLFAGTTSSSDGDVDNHYGTISNSDIWLLKLDSSNQISWQKSIGGNKDERCGKATLTQNGDFIISASSESNNGDLFINKGLYDALVIKMFKSGLIEWTKSIGGTENETLVSCVEAGNGDILVSGTTSSNDQDILPSAIGNKNFWTIRLHNYGGIINQQILGGNGDDETSGMILLSDNTAIITGHTDSQDGDISDFKGSFDVWVANIEIPLAIKNYEASLTHFSACYNSNNNSFQIKAADSESNQLRIYSSEGKIIQEIKNWSREISIDANHFSTGLCVIQLMNANQVESIKILKY